MEKISFVKMSGAGNDFILIDKDNNPAFPLTKNFVVKLCNRRNGVGADGLITISNSKYFDFVMEYFNADGSTGSLCGNGARCAIKFASLSNRIFANTTKFLSNNVPYSGEVLSENHIKFYFNQPSKLKLNSKIVVHKQEINSSFIDTGSPHVVIKIEDVHLIQNEMNSSYSDINDFPVFQLGREIRYLPDFAPGGTNVNFIQIKEGKIFIRTYERGVEDETLACGTGSTASALIAFYTENLHPPIKLITRGGDELTVDFNFAGDSINNLSLTGPAKITFTGEISLNQFL
jgi:diaminopimelate epimerase